MAYGWHYSELAVPGAPFVLATTAEQATTIDSSGDKTGVVFPWETTDAVTHIGYCQRTVTGSPGVLKIGFQGVNSSGNPDGTYLGGGSPASTTFTPSAADDNKWVWKALDNSYTPTLGALAAGVVEVDSGTFDGSNKISICRGDLGVMGGVNFPYSLQDTGGSWAKGAGVMWGYKTASGRYGHYFQSLSMTNVSTSGHRNALAFTFDGEGAASYKLLGCNVVLDFPAAGNVKFGLWEASTLRASQTIGNSQVANNALDRCSHIYFDTYYTLTPGTKYYIGVEADGNAFEIGNLAFTEAEDIGAWVSDYTKLALATFDGSSWSEDTTKTAMVQPIIQAVTGASGGGGAPRFGKAGNFFKGVA